jgi:hypothetical protein
MHTAPCLVVACGIFGDGGKLVCGEMVGEGEMCGHSSLKRTPNMELAVQPTCPACTSISFGVLNRIPDCPG